MNNLCNAAQAEVLSTALRALCLTRDYVGAKTLPAIDGWEWYEVGKAIAKIIPTNKWTMQFVFRTGYCPQCQSETGIKIPRGQDAYCEDCGWPDEDFGKIEQEALANEPDWQPMDSAPNDGTPIRVRDTRIMETKGLAASEYLQSRKREWQHLPPQEPPE